MDDSWVRLSTVVLALALGATGCARTTDETGRSNQGDPSSAPTLTDAGAETSAKTILDSGSARDATTPVDAARVSNMASFPDAGCAPLECDGGCGMLDWTAFEKGDCPGSMAFGHGYSGPVVLRGCGYLGVDYRGPHSGSTAWYEEATGTTVGFENRDLGVDTRCVGRLPSCDWEECFTCAGGMGRPTLPLQCQTATGFVPWDPRDDP